MLPTCYIAGCVRNCATFLPNVLSNINKMKILFREVHLVIAFDFSEDASLHILETFQKQGHMKTTIIVNRDTLSPVRTDRIMHARNTLLKFIYSPDTPSYDYLIMMDMDDVCSGELDLNVLSTSFARSSEWDSLSFHLRDYYDIWALSIEPFYLSCWSFVELRSDGSMASIGRSAVDLMQDYVTSKLNALRDSDIFLECDSAFNGFAIYKIPFFEGCVYNNSFAQNFDFIDTKKVDSNLLTVQSSIFGERRIALLDRDDCEHRYFHMSAKYRKGARICISPQYLFTVPTTLSQCRFSLFS